MAGGAGRLLVMQHGKMVGFLTLSCVIRHLRAREELLSSPARKATAGLE